MFSLARSLGVCWAWTFDDTRNPVEAGLSEVLQRNLVACARKLRKIRADRAQSANGLSLAEAKLRHEAWMQRTTAAQLLCLPFIRDFHVSTAQQTNAFCPRDGSTERSCQAERPSNDGQLPASVVLQLVHFFKGPIDVLTHLGIRFCRSLGLQQVLHELFGRVPRHQKQTVHHKVAPDAAVLH